MIVRMIRILEYVGEESWLENTMKHNAVQKEYRGGDWYIKETILGPWSAPAENYLKIKDEEAE